MDNQQSPHIEPLLTARGISKRYGTLVALDQVGLEIGAGEVVGVVGRSGAGVTTLIKILSGLVSADSGTIEFNQQRKTPPTRTTPHIGVIHQLPELAAPLTVTEQIFLGHELGWRLGKRLIIPDNRRMMEQAGHLLVQLDSFIPLNEKVENLSAEKRQLIAIAQVLAQNNRLILIDNPDLMLNIPYQRKLLQLIVQWQKQGVSVLFSSNNLDHLFAVCERLIVLREGRLVATVRTDETTREEIVSALVGNRGEQMPRTPAIWAFDSYHQARESAELLEHNQRLLQGALRDRDQLNRQLLERLAEQVAALNRANSALQAAQRRLLTEREEERKHLAREIHDQAIQDLLSLNFQLEDIEDSADFHKSGDFNNSNEIRAVRRNIQQLVEDLRNICGALRPPTIDSFGLSAALRSHSDEWHRRTGITVALDVAENFGRLPENIELSIFRIVQEGLNNIWRHAQATRATVVLTPQSPRLLSLSISDDGCGLPASFEIATLGGEGHYGLLGISERVALLGGRMRFENQANGGLLMQVEIPHPRMNELP